MAWAFLKTGIIAHFGAAISLEIPKTKKVFDMRIIPRKNGGDLDGSGIGTHFEIFPLTQIGILILWDRN